VDRLGEILRQARHRKGVSLKEVEEATRIPLKYLIALEGGDQTNLPSPAYVRGFVRLYASFLGLDPAEMLSLLPQEEQAPTLRPMTRVEQLPSLTSSLPFVSTLVAIFLAAIMVISTAWDGKGGIARLQSGHIAPALKGQTVESAIAALEKEGVGFVFLHLSPAEGDVVVDQAPRPGQALRAGEVVVVVLGR